MILAQTSVYRTPTGALSAVRFGQSGAGAAFGAGFVGHSAVQNSYGDVIVAGVDGNYLLWVNTYRASTQSWQNASGGIGVFIGTPALAIGADGTVKICVRDTYQGLWYATYTPSGGLANLQSLGGIFGANMSDPAAAITDDGTYHVVVRDGFGGGQYGGFWFGKWPANGSFQWMGAFGAGQGQPAAVAGRDFAMYVAIRDAYNGVWVARADGGTPVWYGPNGVVTGDPVIVHLVPPDNSQYAYAVVAAPVNGTPFYKRYLEGAGNGWNSDPWTNTAGVLGSLAAASEKGLFYITGRDLNNNIWWFREGGGWQLVTGAVGQGSSAVAAAPSGSSGNRIYKLTEYPANVSNNLQNPAERPRPKAWEPSTASNGAGEWAMAWTSYDPLTEAHDGYFGWFSQGSWDKTVQSTSLVDPFLVHSDRFVYSGLQAFIGGADVRWGARQSSSWVDKGVVMSYVTGNWDYPSIAEIATTTRRTLIGAVNVNDSRFYTSLSLNEGSFDAPSPVIANPGQGLVAGSGSRVIASGQQFRAFVPILDSSIWLPVRMMHCLENFSGSPKWACSQLGNDYAPPLNDSGVDVAGGFRIFYNPRVQAAGSKDGRWAAAFPIQRVAVIDGTEVQLNNIVVCVSERGGITNPIPCAFLNLDNKDQFLGEVAAFPVAGAPGTTGYWFTYLTYTNANRTSPVSLWSCYFTSGFDTPVCHVVKHNVEPLDWLARGGRCGDPPQFPLTCLAPGDYVGIASNNYTTASVPLITKTNITFNISDLEQFFVTDPPGDLGPVDVTPRFTPIPAGTDWRAYAGRNPILIKGVPPNARHRDLKLPARTEVK